MSRRWKYENVDDVRWSSGPFTIVERDTSDNTLFDLSMRSPLTGRNLHVGTYITLKLAREAAEACED